MRIFYIILLIAVVIAAVVFAVQNSAPITVAFFGLTANASMSIVLVITFSAGILLGMFLLLPSIWKRMRALSVQKKKTRHAERQLKEVAGGAGAEDAKGAAGEGVGGAAPGARESECVESVSSSSKQDTEKPSKGAC